MGERYVFSYESKWEKEDQSWLMGLEVPIRGEMIVGYDLKQRKFFGKIFDELKQKAKAQKKKAEFKHLEKSWGEFLSIVLDCQHKDCSFKTVFKNGFLQLEKDDYLLELSPGDRFYRRIRFKTGANLSEDLTKSDLSLDLIVKNCTLN